jgi:hypothetical protein
VLRDAELDGVSLANANAGAPPSLAVSANCLGLPSVSDGNPRQFGCTGALPLAPAPGAADRLIPPSVMLFGPPPTRGAKQRD